MKWFLIMLGIASINVVLMPILPFWAIFTIYTVSILVMILITLVWQIEVMKKIHQQKKDNSADPNNPQ